MKTNENKENNNLEIIKENAEILQMQMCEKSQECDIINIVKDGDNRYRLAIANYVVSENKFETIEAANKYLKKRPYDVLVNMFFVLKEITKNEN